VKVGPQQVRLTPADWVWTEKRGANSFLKPGDLVYVQITDMPPSGLGSATLQEDTGAQGSLMAMDNANGEVVAMVGGRDFALSQFNRATQAQRQVGSSFKPYVYTAAVEEGVKPLDIVVDAPTSFPTPGGYYTPHNYEANFAGPMTVEAAFYESRNIPALKLAARVGIQKVIAVAHKFGITSNLPPYLPIAIGAADITLEEQVGAYAVFPNDGIRIAPHYIRKVTQAASGLNKRRRERGDFRSRSEDDDDPAAVGHSAWHRFGGWRAASSAGRQDRDDERLYRRVVCRVLPFNHLRHLGWLR
jgi:penicillin-binding protein 1A